MGKNRNIEAKRIKYLRQQKARPRFLKMNYGHIKVSQSVDKSKIPKEAVSLFAYRDRAKDKADHTREAFLNAVLDAMFPNFSKPVIREKEPEHIRLINKPVERKLLVVNGRYTKIALLSNRELSCFELIEYQVIPGLIRRSCTYGSYDRAMQVLHLGTVRWQTVVHVPNVNPDIELALSD